MNKFSQKQYFKVLTIAGSDSGGGAGIQADLKTISALGCYGMSAITALTAQNTLGVKSIYNVDSIFIKDQLEAVLEDIGADAIKIGMLHTPEIVKTVADVLRKYNAKNIVVDPVMFAKSGDQLLKEEAIYSLKENLFPLAEIVTPNLPEASALLDRHILEKAQMQQAAEDLLKLGPKSILIKGGHLSTHESSDLLLANKSFFWFEQKRIETANTHGTGCTLSSAIAAHLARGIEIENSVSFSKQYLTAALEKGSFYKIGHGHGPVHHFHHWWGM